jgi:hypothetical protein
LKPTPDNAEQIAVTLMGFDQKYQLPHVLWFDGKNQNKEGKNPKKDNDNGWRDLKPYPSECAPQRSHVGQWWRISYRRQ